MKIILRINSVKYSLLFKFSKKSSKKKKLLSHDYIDSRKRDSSSCFESGMKCSDDIWTITLMETQRVMSQLTEQINRAKVNGNII